MASASQLDPRTGQILQQAVRAAQAGDVLRARSLAEDALAAGGDAVALNAFLGMLSARMGETASAISHLRAAHRLRPSDVTIACNLIAILIDMGDNAAALDVATRELALSDPSLRVARYRGFLAQLAERFDEAVEAYEHVVRHAPDDFETWNNLGNARTAVGDLDGSIAALRRALDLDPEAPPTWLNLAVALRAAERFDESERILIDTAERFPEDARALHELYVQYKREGRHEDALEAIETAVARDPDNANLQLKFGIECGLVKRIADAEQAYRRVIAIDPTQTDAYLGLGVQYEHTNRAHDFPALIALAEANAVDDGAISFLRAIEHLRAGRFEEGLESLSRVPAEIEPERSMHLRAMLLDRLGRTDEAFAAFTQTNRLHAESPTDPLRRAAELREEIRAETALLSPAWIASWSTAKPEPARPDPVFLVGFPRSGTTLLDTILMGHPGTVVLEEQPPLNLMNEALGGMEALPALDEAAIEAARRRYFEEVEKIEALPHGHLLIDKSPLFLHKVPLIHRLFPQARFILALRHPCDVLLSCFMSNFRLNAAMSNFLRLDDAAEFYDLTFRYWERARALFPIQVHTIVYERLVEDVAAEVRPLFDFLGLEWHDDALDHQRTARTRGLITTASYSQVTEPIYKRAAGRWERYRSHLEPILPILAPWAAKFGYAL